MVDAKFAFSHFAFNAVDAASFLLEAMRAAYEFGSAKMKNEMDIQFESIANYYYDSENKPMVLCCQVAEQYEKKKTVFTQHYPIISYDTQTEQHELNGGAFIDQRKAVAEKIPLSKVCFVQVNLGLLINFF